MKLHEIPHSVPAAVRVCARLGVSMVTVHASGGEAMLRAAVDAAATSPHLRVLALSVITSLDDAGLAAVGVPAGVEAQVQRLVRLAAAAGCHGVVTSPREVRLCRDLLPAKALVVVPGVTVPGEVDVVHHVRVGTVGAGVAEGATHVVLGRSITRARDPRAAVRAAAYAIEAGQGASART